MFIFRFLAKILKIKFKSTKLTNDQNGITMDKSKLTPEILKQLKYSRKFEIIIEEKNEHEDGSEYWRPVAIDPKLGGNGRVVINVSSPAELSELQSTYNAAGQRFKIVNEINPMTPEKLYALAVEQGLVSDDRPPETEESVNPVSAPANLSETPVVASPAKTPGISTNVNPDVCPAADVKQKSPIRYYKIGDIEIKDDNGKIYQKQWLALTETESANFRVLNSKTNQIINMSGKKLEMKKWVRVETTTDVTESLEEQLV